MIDGKMIEEIGLDEIGEEGAERIARRGGPRLGHTVAAQRALDEFIESDADMCAVDWREISDDFRKAKKTLSSRIPYAKRGRPSAGDIVLRSNRGEMKVYLVHADRVK